MPRLIPLLWFMLLLCTSCAQPPQRTQPPPDHSEVQRFPDQTCTKGYPLLYSFKTSQFVKSQYRGYYDVSKGGQRMTFNPNNLRECLEQGYELRISTFFEFTKKITSREGLDIVVVLRFMYKYHGPSHANDYIVKVPFDTKQSVHKYFLNKKNALPNGDTVRINISLHPNNESDSPDKNPVIGTLELKWVKP